MSDYFLKEYEELRSLAARQLGRHSGTTWQATALVHEVYLKLKHDSSSFEDRKHFLCTAATVMRHILVDHARSRGRVKRGGQLMRVTLDVSSMGASSDSFHSEVDVLVLHRSLDRLAAMDARQAQIVELRFFIGLSLEEVGALLSMSERTVKRDWALARAWLQRELKNEQ